MIDSRATSPDWQVHPTRVAVSGVGAHEQHGSHLPLDTDSLIADHFARALAGELDAALLPTLRIATSLEHTGFRGSFSLRPETLMAVVRDLAAELERQGFTRWVLLNAHGGNFCLNPVARDINREDRRLKILLCNLWELGDPAIAAESRALGEIHAGEWETSLMMALAPELVRPGGVDSTAGRPEERPLRQGDLTTFGVAHLAPAGAIGRPSLAGAAQGRRIEASVRANLLAHVRDRLARLEREPRYAGPGAVAMRAMLPADIEAAMRLKAIAGWDQVEEDWRLFLDLDPQAGIVAVHNGRVVGTATVIRHGAGVAWVSMVIVDPAFRRMGIGTGLVRRALAALEGCPSVMLDATAAGQPVYERLGFRPCGSLRRLQTAAAGAVAGPPAARRAAAAADLAAAAALDAAAFGAERGALLQRLLARAPLLAFKAGGEPHERLLPRQARRRLPAHRAGGGGKRRRRRRGPGCRPRVAAGKSRDDRSRRPCGPRPRRLPARSGAEPDPILCAHGAGERGRAAPPLELSRRGGARARLRPGGSRRVAAAAGGASTPRLSLRASAGRSRRAAPARP